MLKSFVFTSRLYIDLWFNIQEKILLFQKLNILYKYELYNNCNTPEKYELFEENIFEIFWKIICVGIL